LQGIKRAQDKGLTSVGFCILSAGIFRGSCPLKTIVATALDAIAEYAPYSLENVFFCAFTEPEQAVVREIFEEMELDEVSH
jgi:O-acetyl-ADP-ribose deacetylase (regulator of RNase III)